MLDHCVIRDPTTQDPKSKGFEVVFDYSFVEDHQDKRTRWVANLLLIFKLFLYTQICLASQAFT